MTRPNASVATHVSAMMSAGVSSSLGVSGVGGVGGVTGSSTCDEPEHAASSAAGARVSSVDASALMSLRSLIGVEKCTICENIA